MTSRRERQRKELIAEIKKTAKELMAQSGTAGVSIRAIAKQIGITPPAIHYYFKTVDDLITALLIDGFEALVAFQEETVVQNKDESFALQFYRFAQAFRSWALSNQVEFQLIYGNPIPGYSQPVEQTYPPARKGFALFAGLIDRAIQAGALTPPPQYKSAANTLAAPLAELQMHEGHQHDPAVLYITAAMWSRFHGLVTLELYNLIQPVVGDTALFFHLEICHALQELGVADINTLENKR
ncbi:MAG: TetR/AcrR family transcriptional regulator [Anaerolineae bacterium]